MLGAHAPIRVAAHVCVAGDAALYEALGSPTGIICAAPGSRGCPPARAWAYAALTQSLTWSIQDEDLPRFPRYSGVTGSTSCTPTKSSHLSVTILPP